MRKRKILFVTEANFHPTGYSMYTREVLSRLHKNPDFEIAELACFIGPESEEAKLTPWKIYPNMPPSDNAEAMNVYNSSMSNKFGEFSFNHVLLDFQPDIVMDIRDAFMCDFEERSPFREFFHMAWMPTVDAEPQNAGWIDSFANADAIFSYSEFGRDTMLRQNKHIKFINVASPAAGDSFRPLDKKAIRAKFGLTEDAIIFGTVMRNQRRKLFPDLFKAFKLFVDQNPDLKNVYLYCHTGFPDVGWDIPALILENGLSSRVLLTYKCRHCGNISPSFFGDAVKVCKKCGNLSDQVVGIGNKINDDELNEIYNIFDAYIQWANCLPPGEKVFINGGWKDIENVELGDLALTHKGEWKPVVDLFCRPTRDVLCELAIQSDFETVKMTPEHPVWAITKSQYKTNKSLREFIGDQIRYGNFDPKPEFVKADELNAGDILVFPIEMTEKSHEIDLTSYIGEQYEIFNGEYKSKSSDVSHNINLVVDNEFCKWLGLYVADGCSMSGKGHGFISVTSNSETGKECVALCDSVMSRFGNVGHYEYKNRKAIAVNASNKIFANYMIDHCGKKTEKRFPTWAMTLPLGQQKDLLVGLFMGDCHYNKEKNISTLCTISYDLCRQVKTLCQRLRLNYNVRKVTKGGNRQPQYRFEIRGNVKTGEFDKTRKNSRSFYYGNYQFNQIKSVSQIDYEGFVYNFEVGEHNSYVVNGSAVHNSEGFSLPQVEAIYTKMPLLNVKYSAMESVVNNVEGIGIKPIGFYKELETGCNRAVPNNAELAEWIAKLSRDKELRESIGERCYSKSKEVYNWDKTAKVWADHFYSVELKDLAHTWNSPPRIFIPANGIPEGLNSLPISDQVSWLFQNVLGKPEWINKSMWRKMVKDLTYRMSMSSMIPGYYYNDFSHPDIERTYEQFDLQKAYAICRGMRDGMNQWESLRIKKNEN